MYLLEIKSINHQEKDDFFATDEGRELTQSYWEDEEKLLDKKFARLEAKGEEIEEKRRKVKENLAGVRAKREGKVAEPTEREDQ